MSDFTRAGQSESDQKKFRILNS